MGEQLDTEKAAGRPVKLVRNRIAAKGARILFRELVKVCPVDAMPSGASAARTAVKGAIIANLLD